MATAANHVAGPGRDVWVQLGPKQPLIDLTEGSADDSDWSHPVWSPPGRRLALVSTRGGQYRLWLWERGTKAVRQLSTRSVEAHQERILMWVDDRRLLTVLLAEGAASSDARVTGEREAWRLAKDGWMKMAQGREPTASVLESGAIRWSSWYASAYIPT